MLKKKILLIFYVLLIIPFMVHCGGGTNFEPSYTSIPQIPQYYFAVKYISQNNEETDFSNTLNLDQKTASQHTLTWEPPEQDANGNLITPANIKGYRVYVGVDFDVFLVAFDVGTATSLVLSSVSLP